ncbi:acetyl-CoA carboxylase biotin carboxylase subunit [Leucobacter chromiisoli]|uniref:acetyl-CoA carboxylase biotin carboxylase subunit n=1 Tax=Leucobacter chromiisoli TaxID=2796471 RepID=UPI0027DD23C3|nr:biotin carboxylase N-terminal domain-containing protein [Leucobacter chromiisoli]
MLVANRGEIAVRILRACQELGLETVAVYSEADADARHVAMADRAVRIGGPRPGESYLRAETLVQVALAVGADAIHPGYGFLAESAHLARLCADSGVTFVGPSAEIIDRLGDKVNARRIAVEAGVPVVEGTGDRAASVEDLLELGERQGYPILVKAAAGGGGRGMRIIRDADEVRGNLEDAQREALAAFGSDVIFGECYLERIRHIEVQVVGDHGGDVVHVGTRDCSVQRRYQKIVEEGPATAISPELRARIEEDAVRLVGSIGYVGAGTVEFVVDLNRGTHHFIEMNTRIQVEHPVSEMVSDIDLVREQLWVADPEHRLSFAQSDVLLRGVAIELRINAEDARNGMMPSPGRITGLQLPGGPGVRVDTHCTVGAMISPYYDSMIAKIIVHDRDRDAARRRAIRALSETHIDGVTTNIPFLLGVLEHANYEANLFHTKWLEEQMPSILQVLESATPQGEARGDL